MAMHRVRGVLKRDRLIPPRRLQPDGDGDFASTGEEILSHCVELAGLEPDERVLDVHCGIGRVARPLAGFLGERGSYAGFDADPIGVGWCQARYPERFAFTVTDGHGAPFPCEDASVDLVVVPVALTRVLEGEAERYLAETARVLRPGGRLLAGLFVLDDASRAAIADERSSLHFLQPQAHVAVLRDEDPEDAVAYDEAWLRDALSRAGLTVRAPGFHPGSWRARPGRSFRDLVVADRQ